MHKPRFEPHTATEAGLGPIGYSHHNLPHRDGLRGEMEEIRIHISHNESPMRRKTGYNKKNRNKLNLTCHWKMHLEEALYTHFLKALLASFHYK